MCREYAQSKVLALAYVNNTYVSNIFSLVLSPLSPALLLTSKWCKSDSVYSLAVLLYNGAIFPQFIPVFSEVFCPIFMASWEAGESRQAASGVIQLSGWQWQDCSPSCQSWRASRCGATDYRLKATKYCYAELMLAAIHGENGVVKLLIRNGTPISLLLFHGLCMFSWVLQRRRLTVVREPSFRPGALMYTSYPGSLPNQSARACQEN